MPSNTTIVQKYGGVCLETPAKIRAVASGLADLRSRGYRVVAIVSAMGTGSLCQAHRRTAALELAASDRRSRRLSPISLPPQNDPARGLRRMRTLSRHLMC